MNYNYHAHTHYCHHAFGTPEEYVLSAIENGIEFMGFSDHAPFICANGTESGYRVYTAEAKAYCEEIKTLAEKYKDKIDLLVGYEMEYYPDDFDKMLELAINSGGQYLILGEHFSFDESLGTLPNINESDSLEQLQIYVERIIEGIKTQKFTYIAHPDVINFTGSDEVYREEIRKFCIAAREYNIPLEINFLGIRTNRHYPSEKFLLVAGEEKAPITFGFDSHDVYSAYDGESFKTAMEYVEKYNLNYIGKPEIIRIDK